MAIGFGGGIELEFLALATSIFGERVGVGVENFGLRVVDFSKTVLDDKLSESGVFSVKNGREGVVAEKGCAVEGVVIGKEIPKKGIVVGKVCFCLNNGFRVVDRVKLSVNKFGFYFEKKRSLRIGKLRAESSYS